MTKKDDSTPKANLLEGVISINSKGTGFVRLGEDANKEDDVLIPEEFTSVALHGDSVTIKMRKEKLFNRVTGEVVEVIKRRQERFVGTTKEENGRMMILPDNRRVHVPFSLKDSANVEAGYKVLFEMLPWQDGSFYPEAKIISVIGKKGDNNVEMHSIVLERGFEPNFHKEVEAEAEKIKNEFPSHFEDELNKRRDVRETLTFTIDPADAKDFDDAISFKKIDDDNFEIGVHIADVAHFVTPGSELDKEAQKRGTSVYLVDRTIPMLPEILSNDLCSLNPNEDKFAFSAIFEMNIRGEVSKEWYGRTVINSNKRFTYESAQEVIVSGEGEYGGILQTLNKIAKNLLSERTERGAISFEQDEVKFELDSEGRPLRVFRKVRFDAHKLVEEFMLLANKSVAKYIDKIHKDKHHDNNPLFLYRIHDVPDYDKIAELAIFVKALGHELNIRDGHVKGRDLNALFKRIEGEAEEGIVKTAAIRSMAKAIYSTRNIGHYGLAFDYYTHFTSPIRRYPDTLVHRLLAEYLAGKKIDQKEFSFYERMASQTTEAEIRAAESERESIRMKQVEFMQNKIDQILEGTISGVTEWGMYVEESETKSEGMIRLKDLNDDFYSLDSKNYCLVGEKTKKKYSLGDKVKFKIIGADVEKKTLDLKLVS